MVKIRLKKFGKKKQPFYRVVIANSTNARDGQSIENVGVYDPTKNPIVLDLKKDRILYWISVGAQPSETVERLLGQSGIVEKKVKVPVNPGLTRKQKKEKAA